MPKLLSQAQFARKMKYSRARICQLVKSGIIELKNGRIDPKQAKAAIEANIDRTRRIRSESAKNGKKKMLQSRESPQMPLIPGVFNADHQKGTHPDGFNTDHEIDISSLTEARRQHEAVKIELSKLKLEMEKGNLVPKDQAIDWLSLLVSNAKARFLGLPKRMAGPLAPISNEREIEYKLRAEIRDILKELATPLKESKKKTDGISTTFTKHS
jgi:hypothetical protein